MLSQTSGYQKYFDRCSKNMSFMIKNNNLLVKLNRFCSKIRRIMRKEFDSKLVYDDKYTKTKVKSFNGVIHTNFHDSEAPNEDMNCVCL